MMIIEYLAAIGNVQVKDGDFRYVLSPGDETSSAAPIVQQMSSELWAIPETRDTTPHNKITFNEADCVVRVDGRALIPSADVSGETQEIQTFFNTVYEFDSRYYADLYALKSAEPEPPEPEPMTPERAKAAKRTIIDQDFDNDIAPVTAGYHEQEIKSWPFQEEQAKAYQIDSQALTPLLDNIQSTRGGTKQELAERILTNSQAYAQVFGQALGKKQARVALLESIDLTADDAITQIGDV